MYHLKFILGWMSGVENPGTISDLHCFYTTWSNDLTFFFQTRSFTNYVCLVERKKYFGVSDKMRFKSVSPATETSQKIDFFLVASLDMILPISE